MYDLIDRPVAQLPMFERRVLDAMRRWVHALTLAGAPPARTAEDAFAAAMEALDAGSREQLVIQRPCFSTVDETEAVILGLWRLVRIDRIAMARAVAAELVDAAHVAPMVGSMVRAARLMPDVG